MRKTLLSTLVAGTLAVAGSASAAPLLFDFDGAGGTGAVSVTAFDWAPTSFLAIGGNAAIAAYLADKSDDGVVQNTYTFDVLTHAKMIGYDDSVSGFTGLNRADEITLVARFTETITDVFFSSGGAKANADFKATGAGWIEMYYGLPKDADALTGSGFDNGRLIMRGNGVDPLSTGSFSVQTGTAAAILDQSVGNDYDAGGGNNQLTVTGSGDQTNLTVGMLNMDIDTSFFKTDLTNFSMSFANIGQALPFISVDPSDCFTPNATVNLVGTNNAAPQCTNNHVQGPYSMQGNDGGLTAATGPVNGFLGLATQGASDFVAQADFNSPVTGGAVPEPATLALLGLGLAGLGFSTRRRRG